MLGGMPTWDNPRKHLAILVPLYLSETPQKLAGDGTARGVRFQYLTVVCDPVRWQNEDNDLNLSLDGAFLPHDKMARFTNLSPS